MVVAWRGACGPLAAWPTHGRLRERRWEGAVYEVDFLPVGNAGRHGDAIAMRFTRPDNGQYAHVIIDAGFDENGDALVEHVQRWFNTRSVDLAILTHPDGDHIGGMGTVIRKLDVGTLCVHRLRDRGGDGLPAADAVDELIQVAEENGTAIHEPFAGSHAFGGGLRILGPTEEWYAELVAAQQLEAGERAAAKRVAPAEGRLGVAEAARLLGQRFLAALPGEVEFDDAGGTNPRNNTSAITLVQVDGYRMLFTADAGVPALDRAWDWLVENIGDATPPGFVQLPHHGSRHNASSALLDRILGETGQAQTKTAFVNVGPDAKKHPSPRVANGFMRCGHRVYQTKGITIHHHSADAPDRGWPPVTPLEPLDETQED
jgi:beta-lactamase superfamily II metal-dependent hydrolase